MLVSDFLLGSELTGFESLASRDEFSEAAFENWSVLASDLMGEIELVVVDKAPIDVDKSAWIGLVG